ncbi:Peptidyl-prolyl cis-trans isomerase FKBP16-1, chloroplastic [Ananas comosus]|uniref:peptidylprolyl isomerase n=1 Tax=Ananas comosus TaxID=4615 RepID=A0A199VGZ6_ANACO|nr:Peptidyl-prolyl cis-trans isomerase FKBP16-1, chloroplastic [Ananas comosus]
MEVGALTSLSPIHHSSSIPRHVNKWKPKKLKIYCSGFSPDAFRQLSRRRLLSEFGALGAAISYTNSARSAPLQEAKDPDVIRYQKLSNGVKLQDILEGEGPAAHEGDFVEVNYVCRRSNGYFEHSTVDQFTGESRPVVLPLDEKEIIRGLKDVLIGMKVGGKRRALIPPEVGYINENLKPIPDEFGPRRSLLSHAKETLVFEVQLLKVLY